MRLAIVLTLSLCLGVVSTSVEAGTLAGVTMPDTKTVNGTKLVLNGLGLREATIFRIDVYVVGLYLTKKSKSAKAILASKSLKFLLMKFVRGVGKGRMQGAFKKSLKVAAGKNFPKLKKRINDFNSKMEGVKKGDTISLTLTQKGVLVVAKGKKKGFIKGADFADAILKVFIGKKPIMKQIKRGLLGNK